MFNKMKVGTKLIANFMIVALIAAIIGILGISNMGKINKMLNTLYEFHL